MYYVYYQIHRVHFYGRTDDRDKADRWAKACNGWVTTKEDYSCCER